MTREEQIKAIYEKIADKTLSFGCQVLDNSGGDTGYAHIITSQYDEKIWNVIECSSGRNDRLYKGLGHMDDMGKVIGHPVMIGDVLDYKQDKINKSGKLLSIKQISDIYSEIVFNWKYTRKPIEEQSDETISFIFDLINSN